MQAVEEAGTTRVDIKKAEIELALKDFGLELKRVRESRNINQRELHELTGIDRTVLSELERGLYTPSLSMIRELADGLKINPHILVAAYYGVPLPEFNLNDKETLDSLIKIALDYLARQHQPQPPALTTDNRTPRNAEAYEGVERAKVTNKNRKPKDDQPAPLPTPEDNEDITK